MTQDQARNRLYDIFEVDEEALEFTVHQFVKSPVPSPALRSDAFVLYDPETGFMIAFTITRVH